MVKGSISLHSPVSSLDISEIGSNGKRHGYYLGMEIAEVHVVVLKIDDVQTANTR